MLRAAVGSRAPRSRTRQAASPPAPSRSSRPRTTRSSRGAAGAPAKVRRNARMANGLRPRLAALREPALIATAVLGVLVVWHAGRFQHLTSDTFGLLNGVGVIDRCLHAHQWDCGSQGYGSIGPSAILQYLPALALKRLGATYDGAAHGLVWVNTAAFVLLLALLWHTGRKLGDRRLSALLVLTAV